MKLTFIYSNRKAFTASNVVENSLVLNKDNGKYTVSYQRIKTVDSAAVLQAVSAILPRPADVAESGITATLAGADSILYDMDIVEVVEIDAVAAGLQFVVATGNEYDDFSLVDNLIDNWSSEVPPALLVIPVLADRIKPAVMADALTLFF